MKVWSVGEAVELEIGVGKVIEQVEVVGAKVMQGMGGGVAESSEGVKGRSRTATLMAVVVIWGGGLRGRGRGGERGGGSGCLSQ